MKEKTAQRLKGCSIWVILYGIFVGISLVLQSLPELLDFILITLKFDNNFLESLNSILNRNMELPLDVIILCWTIMVPIYIGVDRTAAFSFISKQGANSVTVGHPEHLLQIVIESFILYTLAVCLSFIVDVNLQLGELATSFGLGVLIYVAGKKSNTLAESFVDLNNNGIDDRLETTPIVSQVATPVAEIKAEDTIAVERL